MNSIGSSDDNCKTAITVLIEQLKPKEDSAADRRAEMKRKAAERRQKMLDKMKGQQKNFIDQHEEEFKDISEYDDDKPRCCVCRLAGDDLGIFNIQKIRYIAYPYPVAK